MKYKHNDITVKATGGWGINTGTYLRCTMPGYQAGGDEHLYAWLVHAGEGKGFETASGRAYAGGFANPRET